MQTFLETSQCSMEQAHKPQSYASLKQQVTDPLTGVEHRVTSVHQEMSAKMWKLEVVQHKVNICSTFDYEEEENIEYE